MIVVVAEKPSVATELAKIVGAKSRKSGYIEGNGYAVTWSFGHLVELSEPDSYDKSLKNWSLEPLPFVPQKFKLRTKKGKGITTQLNVIKKLVSQASEIICATDAGREGELIFRYILEKCRPTSQKMQRLWINSLTPTAISQGFKKLQPLSNFDNLASAAICRSRADWIIGLNATRAYTVKHSHGQGVLSLGRVQTPVLAMIVQRDQHIISFVSKPFYEAKTIYRDTTFTHCVGRFEDKIEAEKIVSNTAPNPFSITKIEQKRVSQLPPLLFDLTELQKVMNKLKGFSAQRTLQAAQKLYEKKLITYPRTDSKYLSDDLFAGIPSLLNRLSTHFPQANKITTPIKKNRRYFNNTKVSDHHAIIPTGVLSKSLSGDEKTLFEIVALRFIAIFFPPQIVQQTTVLGQSAGEEFEAKGEEVIAPGWRALYKNSSEKREPKQLPQFIEGESGPHAPFIHEGETTPPKHFTDATLLSAMETAGKEIEDEELREAMKGSGLGTPATRAATIETLLKREYIRKDKKLLKATTKGVQLIRLLQDQPVLTSPELTGKWEQKLSLIEKGTYPAEDFMHAVEQYAEHIVSRVKEGSSLTGLGACPFCNNPVIKGTKGGYGCSAWKQGCRFRFHGTQFGVTLTEEHVSQLLSRGRLSRIRKLILPDETEVKGYLSLNKREGTIEILTREAKEQKESIGTCPLCKGSVLETYKSFSCSVCDFTIWKKIAGKTVSVKLAQVLLSKGRSMKLKGFRSKKGKRFSAALIIKDGKVELQF